MSNSTDTARGIDPATAKPSDRFLIGVMIALFVILGICMILLVKRGFRTTLIRLRRQRTAVNAIKIRRRRPRLYNVWTNETRERNNGKHYDSLRMCNWEDLQPLAMVVEYPIDQPASEVTSSVQAKDVRHTPVVESSSCQPRSAARNCEMEIDNSRIEEPFHSPHESNRSDLSLDPVDASARISVFISLPSPSRSTRYRLPTSSPPNHPSEIRTDDPYLATPRSPEVEAPPVPTLPPCLALGVAHSPLIVYQ